MPYSMAKEDAENLIVGFIDDQAKAAGAKGAVLGLSGGLDSATVAFLAVRALGPDRVPRPTLAGGRSDLRGGS